MEFKGKVTTVTLGKEKSKIEIGGQNSLPFLEENRKPKLALLLSDAPLNFPNGTFENYREKSSKLLEWADYCVNKLKVDALAVRFTNETNALNHLNGLIDVISVPLILTGTGENDKDTRIMKSCGEAAEGENLLLSTATLEDYKSLAATAMIYGHSIVAENPIDVNIAKQLNILLTDLGLPLEKIIIDPMVASLGYGIEYTFSVMERIRLLGLMGDEMLSSPMICFVDEAWRAREASIEQPNWGPLEERGILWEAMTATTLYSAGADLLVFKHPRSIQLFKQLIGG